MSASRACNHLRAVRVRTKGNWMTVATVTEGNLFSPLSKDWGAAKSGRGKEKHVTCIVLSESSMLNTGDSSVDAKSSGEVVRGKRLTKARCQRGESDGA